MKKSFEKFDYDVNVLAKGWSNNDIPLITTLIDSSSFLERLTIQPNNKGAEPIKIASQVAVLQPSSCTFNPDGDAVLTAKKLETTKISVQVKWCNEDLADSYFQMYLAAGANRENLTVNDLNTRLVEELIKGIKNAYINLLLLGDTDSGNDQLAFHDGLFKLIDDSADVVTVNIPGGDPTNPVTALAVVNQLAMAVSPNVIENNLEPEIMVSWAVYNAVKQNIYNDNNYHNGLQENNPNTSDANFKLPISNITIRPFVQLYGRDTDMYLVPMKLVYAGTDIADDYSAIKVVPDELTDSLNAVVKFRSGIQIALDENFAKVDLTGGE